MGDAFHEVAVATKDVGVVVDDVIGVAIVDGGQVLLRSGDADGHAEPLSEGTGGDFHARGFAVFRVAGGVGSPLTELLKLFHGQVVAGEMQGSVEEHRGVAVGEDEAITVDPLGIGGIMLHELVVEQVGDGSAGERCAGMARVGLLNSVDGEEAEGIDRELVELMLGVLLLVAHSFPSYVGGGAMLGGGSGCVDGL